MGGIDKIDDPNGGLGSVLGILQRDSLLVMSGLLLIASALVMLISRRMTRSLSALASVTEKIAAGDYRLSLPVIRRGHEVGQLADSFRRMVDEVQEREQALTALTQDLERRARRGAARGLVSALWSVPQSWRRPGSGGRVAAGKSDARDAV